MRREIFNQSCTPQYISVLSNSISYINVKIRIRMCFRKCRKMWQFHPLFVKSLIHVLIGVYFGEIFKTDGVISWTDNECQYKRCYSFLRFRIYSLKYDVCSRWSCFGEQCSHRDDLQTNHTFECHLFRPSSWTHAGAFCNISCLLLRYFMTWFLSVLYFR